MERKSFKKHFLKILLYIIMDIWEFLFLLQKKDTNFILLLTHFLDLSLHHGMKNEEDEPSGRLRLLKQCQFLVCKPEHSYLEWVLGAALTRNVR